MTGPAEALLAAHEDQGVAAVPGGGVVRKCECGASWPFLHGDRDYLLHLIEVARTATAEQVETAGDALHEAWTNLPREVQGRAVSHALAATVAAALGLSVEGGAR